MPEQTPDELTVLKQRADTMGLTYHPSIGVEKLREKIAAHLADETPPPDQAPVETAQTVVDAAAAERARLVALKLEQTKLVRIRLTCMNPAKREWDGEIVTVGNDLIGSIKKYIPFNAPDGWHVPNIMVDFLRNRQCQTFVTERTKFGVGIRRSRLINEFAVEVMPDLTEQELKDLAQRQAMAKSVD